MCTYLIAYTYNMHRCIHVTAKPLQDRSDRRIIAAQSNDVRSWVWRRTHGQSDFTGAIAEPIMFLQFGAPKFAMLVSGLTRVDGDYEELYLDGLKKST